MNVWISGGILLAMPLLVYVPCYKLILSDCAERVWYLPVILTNPIKRRPRPLSCFHSAAFYINLKNFIFLYVILYDWYVKPSCREVMPHPGIGPKPSYLPYASQTTSCL